MAARRGRLAPPNSRDTRGPLVASKSRGAHRPTAFCVTTDTTKPHLSLTITFIHTLFHPTFLPTFLPTFHPTFHPTFLPTFHPTLLVQNAMTSSWIGPSVPQQTGCRDWVPTSSTYLPRISPIRLLAEEQVSALIRHQINSRERLSREFPPRGREPYLRSRRMADADRKSCSACADSRTPVPTAHVRAA